MGSLPVMNKIVYLEWYDAVADVGWDGHKQPELHPCKTIGFVISETKEAICVASTVSLEQSNARMHIPKKWIALKRILKSEDIVSEGQRKVAPAVGTGPVNNPIWTK